MRSDVVAVSTSPAFDVGLLSPITVGHDDLVSDAAIVDALVTAEVALLRAWAETGLVAQDVAGSAAAAVGWRGPGLACRDHGLDGAALAVAAVAGGNPVIPLVGLLRGAVPEAARAWIHRGATSQDILDSALMSVARDAGVCILGSLRRTETALADMATTHRDQLAAARTLTQHAVPTTVGARFAGWLRGVRRAERRVSECIEALPAQLGGAGGTLASFGEIAVVDAAVNAAVNAVVDAVAVPDGAVAVPDDAVAHLVRAYAQELGLAEPDAPWHTTRWPVTELGDALVQAIDALGKMATDIATLSRTEIGELAQRAGGGSSAMPQKQNPTASVLIRSAALRAPQLGATLHLASALAGDERPDGAWHAEWPTLRELLRLALGASAHAALLAEGLVVDEAAVARNLGLTGGLIMSERVSIVLVPLIGRQRFEALMAAAVAGENLGALIGALPEASTINVEELLAPAQYLGVVDGLVQVSVAGLSGDASAPAARRVRGEGAS